MPSGSVVKAQSTFSIRPVATIEHTPNEQSTSATAFNEAVPKQEDKIRNLPGSAVAKQLRKEVEATRGKKAKYLGWLPGPVGEYEGTVKKIVKQLAVERQLEHFALNGQADAAFQEELKKDLESFVRKRRGISAWARKRAIEYIGSKYGSDVLSLKFVTGPQGGIFFTDGTNLEHQLIRSENGLLFELPLEISDEDKSRLLKEKGLKHDKESPELGSGTFASVRIAKQLTEDGKEFVAAKEFRSKRMGTMEHAMVRRLPQSDYFSRLLEPAVLPGDQTYLFMELAGYGDGVTVVNRINEIEDDAIWEAAQRTFAMHCIKAVQTLKERTNPTVHHRDIKTENFLVTHEPRVILADFGAASTRDEIEVKQGNVIEPVGSPGYLDPRYWKTGATATDGDKYSLGATLHAIATGEFAKSARTEGWEGYDASGERGDTLISVAKKLMDKDPANRPDFNELLALPYFNGPTVSKKQVEQYLKP